MKKNVKTALSAFIVFGLIVSIMILIRVSENRKFDKLNLEYPEIVMEDSLNGQVTGIYFRQFGGYIPGQVYVTVDGFGKVQLSTDYTNQNDSLYLDKILRLNDFFVKDPMSDQLYLYDNSNKRRTNLKYTYTLKSWPYGNIKSKSTHNIR